MLIVYTLCTHVGKESQNWFRRSCFRVHEWTPSAYNQEKFISAIAKLYMLGLKINLLLTFCLQSQGVSICPAWVSELCCGSCCGNDDATQSCFLCACFVPMAEMCDCSTPNKKSCLDSVCPTKQVYYSKQMCFTYHRCVCLIFSFVCGCFVLIIIMTMTILK